MKALDVRVVVSVALASQYWVIFVNLCPSTICISDFIASLMAACHLCKLLSFNLAAGSHPSVVERTHVEA